VTDIESRVALLLGDTAVGQLRNAGIAVVDAEWASKAQAMSDAVRDWVQNGTLANAVRMRRAGEACCRQSGDH
jgi:hypothetical protein